MTEKELAALCAAITPPDEAARAAAHAHWASPAKPLGGLGGLETTIEDAAALTGSAKLDISRRAVLVLCADNGVVAQGVSQTDSSVTRAVAENLAARRTSVCRMAQTARCEVVPVDMGIAGDPVPGVLDCRIAPGTADFTLGPAMSRETCLRGLRHGIALVEEFADKGYRCFGTGEMGIGNSTPATAINCALFGFDPDAATGPGAGSDPERVRHKAAIVRRALEVNAEALKGDGVDILAALGGFELAIMAGIMLIIAAVLHLGNLTAFVPAPVITGFTSGIAVIIALGQIDNFFGTVSEGGSNLEKLASYGRLGFHPNMQAVLIGLLVVLVLQTVMPAMPFMLAFAAGAMLYVVVEELIPAAHLSKHSDAGTLAVITGFILMMTLDTALG